MAGPPEPPRVLAAAAARGLRNPALSGVLVVLTEMGSRLEPARLQFAFQEVRRGLLAGDVLKTCWVDVGLHPRSVVAGPVNTFGRQQVQQLASIPGFSFPPEVLDLDGLRVETTDVVRLVTEGALAPGAASARLDLGLCRHDGRLAWRVLQELRPAGFRTFVDAATGHVLYEQVDPGTGPDARPGATRPRAGIAGGRRGGTPPRSAGGHPRRRRRGRGGVP
jgi:hypothetical protein